MTADEAQATLSRSEMYDVRPSIRVDFGDPEYDLLNLRLGTLHGLCVDSTAGYENPFRMAHILNGGWIDFHRKFMRGFGRAWVHAAPARSIDGEAFCREMWQELNNALRCWCARNFVNSDGRPALDMTPQQVIEDVEYVGSR